MYTTGNPPTRDFVLDPCVSLGVLILGLAPAFFRDFCCTKLVLLGRHSLLSTEQDFLIVPFSHTITLSRIVPSRGLAPHFGMDSLWHCACSLEFLKLPLCSPKIFPFWPCCHGIKRAPE